MSEHRCVKELLGDVAAACNEAIEVVHCDADKATFLRVVASLDQSQANLQQALVRLRHKAEAAS